MMMKRILTWLLMVLMAVPTVMACPAGDDDDKDPILRPGIRRLHPERERAKAIQKLKEEMSRKAEPKADPWDTSDEVWGTVDVPRVAMKDSAAIVGYRLSRTADSNENGKRLMWRDEPVTATLDELMPYMTVDDGEYRSKYVTGDSIGNEVYFAFTMQENDSLPGPLRLCLRYSGNSPIDCDQVVFTIDSHDYLFYPAEPRHGKTGNLWWVASDDELRPAYKDLVYALAHGHFAIIKLQGTGGVSRAKVLSQDQLDDFSKTLELYRLMANGQY